MSEWSSYLRWGWHPIDGQTHFSLSFIPKKPKNIPVFKNGEYQEYGSDYIIEDDILIWKGGKLTTEDFIHYHLW